MSVGNDLHVPDNASLRILALDVTSHNVAGHDAPVSQVDAGVSHNRLVAARMPLDPDVPGRDLVLWFRIFIVVIVVGKLCIFSDDPELDVSFLLNPVDLKEIQPLVFTQIIRNVYIHSLR